MEHLLPAPPWPVASPRLTSYPEGMALTEPSGPTPNGKYSSTCEACGRWFLGTRRGQRFCSHLCNTTHNKRRYRRRARAAEQARQAMAERIEDAYRAAGRWDSGDDSPAPATSSEADDDGPMARFGRPIPYN